MLRQTTRDWWKFWTLMARDLSWRAVIFLVPLALLSYWDSWKVAASFAVIMFVVMPLAIVVFLRMIANLGPTPVPLWRDEKREQ